MKNYRSKRGGGKKVQIERRKRGNPGGKGQINRRTWMMGMIRGGGDEG